MPCLTQFALSTHQTLDKKKLYAKLGTNKSSSVDSKQFKMVHFNVMEFEERFILDWYYEETQIFQKTMMNPLIKNIF